MVKPSKRVEVNNFVKGLITEASPLNFPANASLDEENFELNRDGTRDRRLGLDLEPDWEKINTEIYNVDLSVSGKNTFKWYGVEGDLEKDFLVVQVSNILFISDLSSTSLSGDGYIGKITLSLFPTNVNYSFASIEGKLVVAAGTENIVVMSYDALETPSPFLYEYKRLKVRDVWGVEVVGTEYETDPTFRGDGTVLNMSHVYNLRNQSWGLPRKDKLGVLSDPIPLFQDEILKYPSNSETVWTGLQFQPVASGSDPFERVFPSLYQDSLGVSVGAAKGYFIIDLLRRGSSRSSEYANNATKYPTLFYPSFSAPSDYTAKGASVIAEFAGRVFYSGFGGEVVEGDARSPNLSNFVLYSQLVKSLPDITKCYQEGDPTSRETNDLVDTDGGFVRISEAKTILSMQQLGSELIVIANNGVWSLSGGSDYGFSATNLKVTKISDFGSVSSQSVVRENKRLFFWAEDGIYEVSKNQVGDWTVNNITEQTIQTFYEEIEFASKQSSFGTYDPFDKKIRWTYKDGLMFSSTSVTKELVLDLVLGAFSRNKVYNLAQNNLEVIGVFPGASFSSGEVTETIYVGSDEVVVDVDAVVLLDSVRTSGIQSVRYLVCIKEAFASYLTYAYYKNTSFRDWEEYDGTGQDAKAFLLTGAITAGDSAVDKQVPYLIMHFKRTEEGVDASLQPLKQSGCLMRSQWNWANSAASKKWGATVQTYRYRKPLFVEDEDDPYDNGFDLVTTRNKIRGRGKAFSFYMETEPFKDCRIVGWNISVNGNSVA